jgi:hypothetical protein
MRTYKQITRIIGIAMIQNWIKEQYDYRLGYIHGLKKRKDSSVRLKIITKIHQLHAEGLSIKQIYNELNLDNPETLANSLIETWNYPEKLNFENLEGTLQKINQETSGGITLEELMMYMLTNFAYALKIKMVE